MVSFTHENLVAWLRETDEDRLCQLWERADDVRRKFVGDEVHLRGLIEISNYCCRLCAYCGLRAENKGIERYRMGAEEILECAREADALGYGTVVMQAGEDYGIRAPWLAYVVRSIKEATPLAVTLSMGERPVEDLRLWREAGADRYLLRFETSDTKLYRLIHPTPAERPYRDRLTVLHVLRDLGYEIGGGVMVGIPGQTYEILAQDLLTFQKMDFDMIGVGPYLSHPDTPLGSGTLAPEVEPEKQTPNSEELTYKVIALTRLLCPEANIPSTTALATVNLESGRERGLQRGANVIMPNLTPREYRALYEIYPEKACLKDAPNECQSCLQERIEHIGRIPGRGPGGRRRGPMEVSH